MLSLDGNFSRMTKDSPTKSYEKRKEGRGKPQVSVGGVARAGTETDLISESSGIVTPIKLQSSD